MEKKVSALDFSQINGVPQFIKDFLEACLPGSEDLLFSVQNIEKKARDKEKYYTKESREALQSVLVSQMQRFEVSPEQARNLDRLRQSQTFTVVTGHQLNLFSGPAFFVYKILQTIKTAEYLNQHISGKQFVPVFWMATEDHDFEEINHFRTEKELYHISADAGAPVGRIKVVENAFLEAFEEEFKDHTYGTELIRWARGSYARGMRLSDATRLLVNRLFSDYGLLVLDGDDARLKAQMEPVFEEELTQQSLLRETQPQVSVLKEKYGQVQVNPRNINLFYVKDQRERIDPDGSGFKLSESGTTFTKEALLDELAEHPEYFSPNALMRPVYQETVLPNVAYIGGNAEIMYWLELKDYFKSLGLPFPVLVPRNSMLFLSAKTLAKIERIGLRPADFFKNYSEIVREEILRDSDLKELLEHNREAVSAIFEEIRAKSSETERTFGNLVEAEEKRQLKAFKRMEARLLKAEKIKQGEKVERLEQLFLEVHPGKTWQERVYNFSVFYANGGRGWLEACFDMMNPSKSELIIAEV